MNYPEQVSLILKLNHLMDQLDDAQALRAGFLNLIADALRSDLAVLAVPDEEPPHALVIRSVVDRQDLLGQIENQGGANHITEWLAQTGHSSAGSQQFRLEVNQADIHALSMPIFQGETQAGSVFLARVAMSFSADDIELLKTAEAPLAHGLRYARTIRRLSDETIVLRTLLKMDRIRDTSTSLDDLLNRGLEELCRVVPAVLGFVMLYNRLGEHLELRAATDQALIEAPESLNRLSNAADDAIQKGAIIHRVFQDGEMRALLCLPLILNNRIIGVLGVANRNQKEDFTSQDRQLLYAIGSQMDTAIFERLQSQRLRETFERSVGARVMERLLQIDDHNLLKGERVIISALFSDIRGFTTASQKMDAGVIEEMINQHLAAMTRVVLEQEGTLDKFLGDGLLALFNVPVRQEDFALRAVRAGIEMQRAHQKVMQSWAANGREPLPIGIGIATGEVISGSFGSAEHAEYSSIGMAVNLASRLCDIAAGGEILIDTSTHQLLNGYKPSIEQPPRTLKGFDQPVPFWKITELNSGS